MDLPVNAFRAAIFSGRPQIGLWCALAGSVTAEICAGAGFDWLLLDGEHAPSDINALLLQLQAVQPYPLTAIVRPAVGNAVTIKQLLDIGALNLLIPMVDTAEQARELAAAVCYPPGGVRGVAAQTRAGRWGRVKDYLGRARHEICLIVQVESAAGLANVDGIAEVDGVDAVFIGPSDLAAALGFLGQPGRPEVQDAVEDAIRRVQAAGKPVGILTTDAVLAQRYLDLGVTFIGIGMDTMLLAQATSALRQHFAART